MTSPYKLQTLQDKTKLLGLSPSANSPRASHPRNSPPPHNISPLQHPRSGGRGHRTFVNSIKECGTLLIISINAPLSDQSVVLNFISRYITCYMYVNSVLLLGILKKGPDPARTFKKRANQNISGPHTHLMQNTLSISICALPFYKKLL